MSEWNPFCLLGVGLFVGFELGARFERRGWLWRNRHLDTCNQEKEKPRVGLLKAMAEVQAEDNTARRKP